MMFRDLKAGDTVWVQTTTGRTARFAIQQVEDDTIIAPDGVRYASADIVEPKRRSFSAPKTAGLVAGIRVRCALVAVAAMLLSGKASFAQPADEARNAVYLELLGSGGLFSLNYEREIVDGVLVRAGFGSWTATSFWSDAETTFTTVPLTIAVVRGGRHRVEFGGGVTFGRRERESFAGVSGSFASLTGLLGYRYEKPGRGFLFRAGVTPFYGFGEEDVAYPEKGFFPSFGLSLGYSF